MLKRSRHSVLLSYLNYAILAPKKRKHKSSTYIKPDILPILSPTRKAQPDLKLWEGASLPSALLP